MADRFTRQGWLRLAVLYADNKPVTAQTWFVVRGKASIFRLSNDNRRKPGSRGTRLIDALKGLLKR